MPEPADDIEREQRLDKILNTHRLAEMVTKAIREDRVAGLTAPDYVLTFQKPVMFFPTSPYPEIDVPKLFEFLAQLVCPLPCVGVVNGEGWHQLCEQKAQDAVRALGLDAPDLTPIPGEASNA